jgi:hypothetical protein
MVQMECGSQRSGRFVWNIDATYKAKAFLFCMRYGQDEHVRKAVSPLAISIVLCLRLLTKDVSDVRTYAAFIYAKGHELCRLLENLSSQCHEATQRRHSYSRMHTPITTIPSPLLTHACLVLCFGSLHGLCLWH